LKERAGLGLPKLSGHPPFVPASNTSGLSDVGEAGGPFHPKEPDGSEQLTCLTVKARIIFSGSLKKFPVLENIKGGYEAFSPDLLVSGLVYFRIPACGAKPI
jgi:hypothetical protein